MQKQENGENATHTQNTPSDRLAAQADGKETETQRDAGKRSLHPRMKALVRRHGGKVQIGRSER